MKLSVNLVVHNEEKYIPYLTLSLKNQTFKDFEVLVIDNASTDKTAELLEKGLSEANINFRIFKQSENLGFAGGHNLAYNYTQADYFVLQNADMYIMPDVFEKAVNFLDQHQSAASISPRLMHWDFSKVSSLEDCAAGFTKHIDALGIKLFRNRRAIETFSGILWSEENPDKKIKEMMSQKVIEVFGVSGAMAFYRKEILDGLLLPGKNIFDPTYHSYKEDLDLAYRLRNAGMLSFVLLEAVAYHDRTSAGLANESDLEAIKNKKRQSYYVRFNSYKNHLATLYKNEYWQNLLLDSPFILWFELRKKIYIFLTEPSILFKTWGWFIKNRAYLKQARKSILETRKMYWKGIRRWF